MVTVLTILPEPCHNGPCPCPLFDPLHPRRGRQPCPRQPVPSVLRISARGLVRRGSRTRGCATSKVRGLIGGAQSIRPRTSSTSWGSGGGTSTPPSSASTRGAQAANMCRGCSARTNARVLPPRARCGRGEPIVSVALCLTTVSLRIGRDVSASGAGRDAQPRGLLSASGRRMTPCSNTADRAGRGGLHRRTAKR